MPLTIREERGQSVASILVNSIAQGQRQHVYGSLS